MTEENDLIKRFEGIFIAHYPAVKGFIAALLKSEAYAEDLAQDIFARLWTRHDIWAERDGGHSGYIYATPPWTSSGKGEKPARTEGTSARKPLMDCSPKALPSTLSTPRKSSC